MSAAVPLKPASSNADSTKDMWSAKAPKVIRSNLRGVSPRQEGRNFDIHAESVEHVEHYFIIL